MKDWNEIVNRAQMEVEQWFVKQCRNNYINYYWYYIGTTPEHDGGFLIAEDKPVNSDYAIAARLEGYLTKDQNLYRFLEIARRLPILSYE